MDLSGRFQFSIEWIETQPVVVTRHRDVFILRLKDRYDRYRIFESRNIGYNVTEFKIRSSSIPRIVVYGQWDDAFYVDERGRQFGLTIHGQKKEDTQAGSRSPDQGSKEP